MLASQPTVHITPDPLSSWTYSFYTPDDFQTRVNGPVPCLLSETTSDFERHIDYHVISHQRLALTPNHGTYSSTNTIRRNYSYDAFSTSTLESIQTCSNPSLRYGIGAPNSMPNPSPPGYRAPWIVGLLEILSEFHTHTLHSNLQFFAPDHPNQLELERLRATSCTIPPLPTPSPSQVEWHAYLLTLLRMSAWLPFRGVSQSVNLLIQAVAFDQSTIDSFLSSNPIRRSRKSSPSPSTSPSVPLPEEADPLGA